LYLGNVTKNTIYVFSNLFLVISGLC